MGAKKDKDKKDKKDKGASKEKVDQKAEEEKKKKEEEEKKAKEEEEKKKAEAEAAKKGGKKGDKNEKDKDQKRPGTNVSKSKSPRKEKPVINYPPVKTKPLDLSKRRGFSLKTRDPSPEVDKPKPVMLSLQE